MKEFRLFTIPTLLLLGAASALAQGNEWDALNREVRELYSAGEYDRAEVMARKALEVAEATVDPDHPAVATSLSNLASLYMARANYAEAERLYLRALTIGEKALGPDHPTLAIRLSNLA